MNFIRSIRKPTQRGELQGPSPSNHDIQVQAGQKPRDEDSGIEKVEEIVGNNEVMMNEKQNPQELNEELQQLPFFKRKPKTVIGITTGSLLAIGLVIGLVLYFVLMTTIKSGGKYQINFVMSQGNAPYKAQTSITNEDFTKESKSVNGKVPYTTSKIQKTETLPASTRRLQEKSKSETVGPQPAPKTIDVTSSSTTIELICQRTGISIKLTTTNFDAVAIAPLNKILQNLITKFYQNSQVKGRRGGRVNKKRTLQDEISAKDNIAPATDSSSSDGAPQTLQFYDVIKLAKSLVEKIITRGNNDARVTLQKISERAFDATTNKFEPVKSAQTKAKIVESFSLISEAEIPEIKDIYDEREVANAVAKVIEIAMKKAGAFFRESAAQIIAKSGVDIAAKESTLSVFADQPSDTQRLCNTVNAKQRRVRCTQIGWQSGALPVSDAPQEQSAAIAISAVLA